MKTPSRPAVHRRGRDRRGYALLAALWVIVGVATLALGAAAAARDALHTSRNRRVLARAEWSARGCAAQAQAALDAVLADAREHPGAVFATWRALDAAFAERVATTFGAECSVQLIPAGTRVDLNAADTGQLHALFAVVGIVGLRADSLVAALVDWRDADDVPVALGAERASYHPSTADVAAEGVVDDVPRNGPLASMAELHRVRGYDAVTIARLVTVADVEPGRLSLPHAAAAALASLPGFGPEVLAEVARRRQANEPVTLAAIATSVSPPAARALGDALPVLADQVTEEPEAWTLLVTAPGAAIAAKTDGDDGTQSRPTARLELRIGRAGWRVVVLRRKSQW